MEIKLLDISRQVPESHTPDTVTEGSSNPQVLPKVWTDEETLARALAFIEKKISEVDSDHQNRVQRWLEFDQAYQNIRRSIKNDGGANIVDPEPYVNVETLVSNIVEAFFAQDPPFKYIGSDETDDEQAEIMTSVRADHLRRIGIREKFERSIRQLIIYGTCIVKTPWRKEVKMKNVRVRVPAVGKDGLPKYDSNNVMKMKVVDRKVPFPVYDDTDWEFVSIFDFYPVGYGADIQDLEGCIHRTLNSYDQLKSMERVKDNIEGVEIYRGVYVNLEALKPASENKMNVYEYSGKIPRYIVTGKEEDKYVCFEGVIAAVLPTNDQGSVMLTQQHETKSGGNVHDVEKPNSGVSACIRVQENPYWSSERHFLSCPWTPQDNEFYGIGCIQPIFELWEELNDTRNQLLDNKTLMLRQPMLEDVSANVQRDVNLARNSRIKCDDINGIKPLAIQNFQNEGWKMVQAIKDDIRRATGAIESVQGIPLSGDTSATEFSAIAQQAGVRIKNHIKLIDEKLFKRFLDRSYQYDMQFSEFEKIIKIVGPEGINFKRVAPEDIWGTFDIVTNGPTQIENNAARANKLINFLSIVARIPNIANLPEILKEIWISFGFAESQADKIIVTTAEDSQEKIMEENKLMSMGQPVLAHNGENHIAHIQGHGQLLESLRVSGGSTPEVEQMFKDHILQHTIMLQRMTAGQPGANQVAQNGGQMPMANPGAPQHNAPSPVEQVAQ